MFQNLINQLAKLDHDMPEDMRLVTLFGPEPGRKLVHKNGEWCIPVDNEYGSLYPLRTLKEAVWLFNRIGERPPLMFYDGTHYGEAGFAQPVIFGEILSAQWDPSTLSLLGIVRLNDAGLAYVKEQEALGEPIGLSWVPKVKRSGRVIRKIEAIQSVDIHFAPGSGARFGRLPERAYPVREWTGRKKQLRRREKIAILRRKLGL